MKILTMLSPWAILLLLFSISSSSKAASLDDCSESSLRAAVAEGGQITFGCDATFHLTAPLEITKDTTLDASNRQVTLSGGGNNRVIHIREGARLELRDLTITDGYATHGGGIFCEQATLLASDVKFTRNTAIGYPHDSPLPPEFTGGGGAIHNFRGTVILSNAVFQANQARGSLQLWRTPGYGGAILNEGGELTVFHSELANNVVTGADQDLNRVLGGEYPAHPAFGGAVYNTGEARFIRTRLVANTSLGSAGAPGNSTVTAGGGGSAAMGGAIYNKGALTLLDCTFKENFAQGGPGGVGAPSVDLFRGSLGGNGGPARGGALVSIGGSITLGGSTFHNNRARGGQGGAGGGGATGFNARGTSTGGIGGSGGNGGEAHGGACYIDSLFTSVNSTVYQNHSVGGSGGSGGVGGQPGHTTTGTGKTTGNGGLGGKGGTAEGAGCYIAGGITHLTHLTFALNQNTGGTPGLGGEPGPVSAGDPGVTSGSAGPNGAEGSIRGTSIAVGSNALVAPHLHASLLESGGAGQNYSGLVLDAGYNLSSDSTPEFIQNTSRSNQALRLGTFDDHGGPTKTIALRPSSPALNKLPNGPEIDQRGESRPVGSLSDIGAFEGSVGIDLIISRVTQGYQIEVTAAPGRTVTLESSASLSNWKQSQSMAVPAGGVATFIVEATQLPFEFFKPVID